MSSGALNIVLAGVGGQGILSIAWVLDAAAMAAGYQFKQAEVHGMAQRGGAVQSHLRIAQDHIWSDLIPDGRVDLVLSVEPLESLRYTHTLAPTGVVVTSSSPFVNIPDYPDLDQVVAKIAGLPSHVLVDSAGLAKLAGSTRAENMVMTGAASWLFPFPADVVAHFVAQRFAAKSDRIQEVNRRAFQYGRVMSEAYRAGLELGLSAQELLRLLAALDPTDLDITSLPAWKQALHAHPAMFAKPPRARVPGTTDMATEALGAGSLG